MNVESLKNKIDKRIKVANSKLEFNEVGSYIKRKRKELNITQDEIAKGICSISYLSKIENNQIIPKEFYVKELFSRMNISTEIYNITVNDRKFLERALYAFFFYDSDLIEDVYSSIKNITNNIAIEIIKYIYSIYSNKDNTIDLQKSLENLIANMDIFELKVYLLLSAVHYTNQSKYKKALKILKNNKKLVLANDTIESLIYYYQYICKQNIGLTNCSHEDFYKYINLSNKYHNTYRKMNLVLIRLNFLSEENPKETLLLLNEINIITLKKEQLNYYYLIKGNIELLIGEIEEGKKTLNSITINSKHVILKNILLYQLALNNKDKDEIDYYFNHIKQYVFNYKTLKYKIMFELISLKNKAELKGYLKDVAIPYSIEIEDIKNLKKYTYMLMDICSSNSRYKEASQHFKKYQKELIKLTTI